MIQKGVYITSLKYDLKAKFEKDYSGFILA